MATQTSDEVIDFDDFFLDKAIHSSDKYIADAGVGLIKLIEHYEKHNVDGVAYRYRDKFTIKNVDEPAYIHYDKVIIKNVDNSIRIYHDKTLIWNTNTYLELDRAGNFYFDYRIIRDCDIIDNITGSYKLELAGKVLEIPVKLSYIIDIITERFTREYEFDKVDKFLLTATENSRIKLRFTFLEPLDPETKIEINVKSRKYYLYNYRVFLRTTPIKMDLFYYKSGLCKPFL